MPTLCALGGTAAAGHLQQRRGVHDELQPAAFSVEGALLSVVKKDDKLTTFSEIAPPHDGALKPSILLAKVGANIDAPSDAIAALRRCGVRRR